MHDAAATTRPSGPIRVAGRAPAGAARAAIAEQVKALLSHAPAVIAGAGGEDLHELRIASRRLRAVVHAFGPAFPRRLREERARELKALTDVLGPAREWDVQVDGLERELSKAETPAEREALAWVLAGARSRRDELHRAMSVALAALGLEGIAARALALPAAARRVAPKGAARPDGAGEPRSPSLDEMRLVARATLEAAVAEARRRADAARAAPADDVERLHAARIGWKKVRYALEMLAPAFERGGPPALAARDAAHDHSKRIQDVLGKHHDKALLEDLAAQGFMRLEALRLGALARGLLPAIARVQGSQEAKRLEFLELSEPSALASAVDPALAALLA